MSERRKCSLCGRPGHDRRSCGKLGRRGKPFDPWSDLEWEEHGEAQQIVAENPDGMTLEQVGAVLGVTRERVRQIEAQALRKLRDGVGLAEAVTVGDHTIAVVICERCDVYFPRDGRLKICPACAGPRPRKRPALPPPRRALPPPPPPEPVPPPVVKVVDVAALEIPTDPIPSPIPTPLPGFSLAVVFDFGDL